MLPAGWNDVDRDVPFLRKRVGESDALIVGVLKVELVELVLEQFLVWQMSLVLGDERGGQGAAERIFHDLVVLAGAQQHTDRRTLMGFPDVTIQGFQIKGEFPEVMRSFA